VKNTEIQNEINKSIRKAVADADQDEELANRIIAWFRALSEGNENIDDRITSHNHIDLILKHVNLSSKDKDAEEENDNAD
jgi:hypothetical protein